MQLLIVDDKRATANYICEGLKALQFNADAAYDGKEALFMAQEKSYDLVVLDVMLPILDGWGVLAQLRDTQPELPILMLSACDDVESRIKGLESGADDYLIKPFSFHELVARIKTILRRKPFITCSPDTIADLRLNHQTFTAYRRGEKLLLSSKEFKLLSFLMKHQGEVLTRTVIAEQVWDINFECNTNVIDVAIRRLREKIDDTFQPKLIHTVRGVGYILEVR
ncbi:MAG: heavy metal response regulator transcription factor [Legionellaceae bacterium]|nr:heavy metal response regulator transcription factor [Legionellaceae bacterium]